jgi:isochorismate synthase EntC
MNGKGLHGALASYLERGLTFACFRRPGKPIDLWVQRTPELDTVDSSLLYELNEVFLLAPFQLDPERIPFLRSDKDFVITDPAAECDPLLDFQGTSRRRAVPQPSTPMEDYQRAVEDALKAFGEGHLEKAVLSRVLNLPLHSSDLPGLFLTALEAYPLAFVALVHTPDHGTWLGATPERLLAAAEDIVRVDALAATRAMHDVPEDADAWNPKERHEQALVTTGVLGVLVGLGLRELHTRGPEVMHTGTVAHLRTTVEADLGGKALADVVLALHPTAAVCGTPRDRARTHILAAERHERRLYSGFWGPWSADGETELFVNLRCLEAGDAVATLYVGAGIVPGSDPQREWEETEHKATTWRRLIEALPGRVSSPPDAHQ